MTNYTYKRNIPAAANNPSNDQGDMLTNTNSTDSIIGEDHYSFGDDNGGLHKQVRIIGLLGTPGGRAVSGGKTVGTLWTENTTTIGVTKESELFYVPDNTSDRYQLTRTIHSKISLFATNTIYQAVSPPNPQENGGWTFLPGGMLLQYGIATDNNLSSNNEILFPVAFTSFVGSITLGVIRNNSNDKIVAISDGDISLTGFKIILSNSSQPKALSWMAIGK